MAVRGHPALAAIMAGLGLVGIPMARSLALEPQEPPAARFDGIWYNGSKVLRYAPDPPLLPAAKARFEALRPQDDPGARCIEPGTARIMISPYPLEIVARRDHILVLAEFAHVIRRIWTDTKVHEQMPDPTYYGDSVVTWDGNTMVVDTIGYNGTNYLDPVGDPQSDAMHIIERWRLINQDSLEIAFKFDDPKNYSRSWAATVLYKRVDWKLGEFSCTDNNRNNPDDPNNPKNFTSTDKASPYILPFGRGASAPAQPATPAPKP